MTNAIVKHEEITTAEWNSILGDLHQHAQNAQTKALLEGLVGTEALEAYLGGEVGIGWFSKLVKLPVTTVRHYIELGLVRPYTLNTKFRFVLPNHLELMHVRQWVDLNVSLEEIVQRSSAAPMVVGGLPTLELNGKVESGAVMTITRNPDNAVTFLGTLEGDDAHALFSRLGIDWRAALHKTVRETDDQIVALEGKQRELAIKLERARELKTSLEQVRDTIRDTKLETAPPPPQS